MRNIEDSGYKIKNEISIKKDLSEDVHVKINATYNKMPMFEDMPIFNCVLNTVLTVDYYGELYTFSYRFVRHGDSTSSRVFLPNGITFNQDSSSTSPYKKDLDSEYYFKLLNLICTNQNNSDKKNLEAIACFEQIVIQKECLELFAQGSLDNPLYSYIKELIENQDYQTATKIMQSEESYWIS